jgi:ssDNA-binding Zn-finger/Zn-ribbon topoisomerase 1
MNGGLNKMEKLFRNFYRCPKCNHEWSDTGIEKEQVKCPACEMRDIIPYASEDISNELTEE